MTPPRRAVPILGLAAIVAAACSGVGDRTPDDDQPGATAASDSGAIGGGNAAGGAPPPGPERTDSSAGTRRGTTPTPLPPPPPSDPDTARGLVAVVGADPMTRVMLRDSAGVALMLSGPHTAALSRLAGIEIWVAGTRSAAGLAAARFIVRAVDGAPARDGQLLERGGTLVLRRPDGATTPIPNPPAALRTHVGKRIWVTMSATGELESFGVIEEPSSDLS